jgi:hypothetical protein
MPSGVTTHDDEWILALEKMPDPATFSYSAVKGDETTTASINAARKTGAVLAAILGKAPGQFGMAFGGNPAPLLILQQPTGGALGSEGEREYRIVSTKKTGTLEEEVRQAASGGFRPIGVGFMTVVLERDAQKAGAEREYRVVATSRFSTAEREVQTLASEGFRIVGTPQSSNEWVFVLERSVGSATRVQYRLVELRTRTADETLRLATADGYRVVGLVERVAVLEKSAV